MHQYTPLVDIHSHHGWPLDIDMHLQGTMVADDLASNSNPWKVLAWEGGWGGEGLAPHQLLLLLLLLRQHRHHQKVDAKNLVRMQANLPDVRQKRHLDTKLPVPPVRGKMFYRWTPSRDLAASERLCCQCNHLADRYDHPCDLLDTSTDLHQRREWDDQASSRIQHLLVSQLLPILFRKFHAQPFQCRSIPEGTTTKRTGRSTLA